MTDKEKARAYDEAIRKAQDISHTSEFIKITDLFPQLSESEDERIRKWIVNYIHRGVFDEEEHPNALKAIAWLEKQKEQNPINHNLTTWHRDVVYCAMCDENLDEGLRCNLEVVYKTIKELVDRTPVVEEQKPLMCDGEIEDKKRDIVAAIRKHYPADYAEYLTSFLKGLSPEDNSEDEYGQKMLGIAYKLMYKHIPENLRTQEFWDSLKFMREYTGKVAIIHSYEKPTEWSEEDEEKINNISEIIEHCIAIPYSGGTLKLSQEYKKELQCFLKSLRPSWKPSEEQMEALGQWLKDKQYDGTSRYVYPIFESLHNDLEKLIAKR